MIDVLNTETTKVLLGYGDALIGLLGVIVGGIIVALREWWVTRSERQRDGSYSAIRLICILEEYAHKCIDVANDDGYFQGQPGGRMDSGEEVCKAQSSIPDPLEYPEDLAWRSLDESIMHRVLALPNMARSTDGYVSGSAEHAMPPEYAEFFEPRQEGYARLGLETLQLIDDLRRRYAIKAKSHTELSSGWDPKESLQNRLDQFAKRDAERDKIRSASDTSFPTPTDTANEASKT